MAWSKHTISMDDRVWNESRKFIKEELNMPISKFIEMQLRMLLRSRTQTQQEMYEGMAEELLIASKKLNGRRKKK